ncbi:ABC transporter permease [Streptomyces sp. CFMR 7]|uniref:ABC transporter permease n=1 Tax=Streptomyces sp. CFMR 7 TaxID=1649184 RepID=UPI0006AD5474|nr:ABC transporter permease [Streptomyces sp. CFMR 7]ALC31764.1 ABC transporter permease [Streptomyces sp. CFMR 7]
MRMLSPRPAPAVPRALPAPTGGGLPGAVRAEWTKLRSLRSPYICLSAGALLTVVFTFYYGSIARINDHPVQPLGNAAVASVVLVQFAVVVLAMVAVTSEYTTGSVRSSLLWVPVRRHVLLAKSLVAGVVGFGAGLLYAVLGMAVAWPSFDGHASFDAAEATAQALAMAAVLALTAVLSVGVSFALRNAAGALSALFGLLSALPALCVGLGGTFLLTVDSYLPQTAGGHFMLGDGGAPYPRWAGLLIVAAWAAVAQLAGRALLVRRDA